MFQKINFVISVHNSCVSFLFLLVHLSLPSPTNLFPFICLNHNAAFVFHFPVHTGHSRESDWVQRGAKNLPEVFLAQPLQKNLATAEIIIQKHRVWSVCLSVSSLYSILYTVIEKEIFTNALKIPLLPIYLCNRHSGCV